MRLTVHRLEHLPESHRSHADLILQGHALPDGVPFYLATFNDRAVALAWHSAGRLGFFAVRDITRRRGVGSELLRRLQADAAAEGLTRLELPLDTVPAGEAVGLSAFFTARGFREKDGVLSCSL